jgi:hypothetical protein
VLGQGKTKGEEEGREEEGGGTTLEVAQRVFCFLKRFLETVRIHAPLGLRKQAVPSYHDVRGQLKEKLVILLMVDTGARPSDIHRLFRVSNHDGTQCPNSLRRERYVHSVLLV